MMRLASTVCLCFLALNVLAQEKTAPPNYTNLRFDEDWSGFDPAESDAWFKDFKRIQLSEQVWLSLGGDARIRYEYFDNFNFDREHDDGYLLYRTFLHADLHLGSHLRVFLQGRFADLSDRDLPGGNREALDYDKGDFWNTFVELRVPTERLTITTRLGRQELQYGAQRLISPLDWANNRRIFDGTVVQLAQAEGRWKLDAIGVWPVAIRGASLTRNKRDRDHFFGGLYFSQKVGGPERPLNWDGYFLVSDREFPTGADETRYTAGGRLYGQVSPNIGFEVEGAYQFGSRRTPLESGSNKQDIRAWMATAQATYTFNEVRYKPFLIGGFDYASGDGDPNDSKLGTFNPLFPLGHAFLGYIDLVGRQNIMDSRVSAGFWPMPGKLRFQADYHYLRRARGADGLYNAGGGLIRSPQVLTRNDRLITVSDKTVGHEVDLTLFYKHNRHLDMLFGYSRFWTGDYLRKTGASDNIHFFYSQMEFTF